MSVLWGPFRVNKIRLLFSDNNLCLEVGLCSETFLACHSQMCKVKRQREQLQICLISNNDMTLSENMNSMIWKKWGWRWLCEGAWACIQWQLPLYAGWSRLWDLWDLPIGCSSEYPQSNQLMILKTTDLPRLLAKLQATACQKQCYAEIFQHFQQLAQCFSPLWFC